MGIIRVTASVTNLTRSKAAYEAEFLVDTGALHCLAPASALKAAGVEVEGEAVYELANGDEVKFDYGFARLAFLGDETVARFILGPERAEPLIGVVALESVGIMVDPVSQTLKRMAALPLK